MRPLFDAALQRLVGKAQLFLSLLPFKEVTARLVLSTTRPERCGDSPGQGLSVDRSFQHDDIAEALEDRCSVLWAPANLLCGQ